MNNDFITILGRMKEKIENGADTREGSWTADNLQAVANELARIYSEDIDTILPRAFVTSANGFYLEQCCSDYGIARREAAAAEVMVSVKGEPGNYYGIQLYAGDISFMVPDAFMIPPEGEISVRAVCSQTGSIGNVAAGSINKAGASRITRVNNPEAAAGGYDEETDESLRERTLEHIRTPANSGNIAHYMQWAKEITGVSKVKVYDLARGPGTVDVVIIADGNRPAPESLTEAVENHIESVRPVGADVLVASGQAVDIRITAEVIVKKGYTAAGIRNSLYELLEDYCKEIAFQSGIISYLGMVKLIFDCPGVVDAANFSINGAEESIRLQDREFPAAAQPEIIIKEEAEVKAVAALKEENMDVK